MNLPVPNLNPAVIVMNAVTATSMRDPNRVVVEGVNWSVAPGDYWVVAGLHGAGKSDFLMMTAGLLAATDGVYKLFGEDMPIFEDSRLPARLRLGVVFDGGQLFSRLTVAENIALPLRYHQNLSHAEVGERLSTMLEFTELGHVANVTPSAIGRNWQKRVGLARALMLQPDVLLLDNPLTGLDARHANWWLGFLDQLSAGHTAGGGKSLTLAVTTESLLVWRGHGRQFALLKEKEFIPLGGWAEVERAREPIVREMLSGELPAGAAGPTRQPTSGQTKSWLYRI